MLVSGIHSRPRYQRLAFDPAGTRHLVISDAPRPLPEVIDGVEAVAAPVEFWIVAGIAQVSADAVSLSPEGANAPAVQRRSFRATPQLLDMLDHRLRSESVGLRVYAMGEEGFVWGVARLARERGLEPEECRLDHAGSMRRRVFCVHCKTITEGVTTSLAACAGCGAQLVVRDHFSKRLNAFMGVQADAEAAGELPPVEELFP